MTGIVLCHEMFSHVCRSSWYSINKIHDDRRVVVILTVKHRIRKKKDISLDIRIVVQWYNYSSSLSYYRWRQRFTCLWEWSSESETAPWISTVTDSHLNVSFGYLSGSVEISYSVSPPTCTRSETESTASLRVEREMRNARWIKL